MKNKKFKYFLINIFPIIRILFYLTLYISFSVISINYINSKSLCFMYEKTGIICSTCGVTRAFCLVMHGKFALAFQYNQIFVAAIFPIFTIIFLEDTINYLARLKKKDFKPSILEYVITGIFLWK